MTHLKVGDEAPLFEAKNQNGDTIALKDLRGKKVVLFFYPKDNTPGCTTQACNLRDNIDRFNALGYVILGVSIQGEASHQKFIAKHEFPFDLLVDEDKTLNNLYGVWGEKKFMGRVYDGTHRETFVIDEEGKLIDVITKVKTKEHSTQILGE